VSLPQERPAGKHLKREDKTPERWGPWKMEARGQICPNARFQVNSPTAKGQGGLKGSNKKPRDMKDKKTWAVKSHVKTFLHTNTLVESENATARQKIGQRINRGKKRTKEKHIFRMQESGPKVGEEEQGPPQKARGKW